MLSVILLFCCFVCIVASSDISTFKDGKCTDSFDNINGPNGYPNGTCTPLHLGSLQSFQIVGLDKGCAVTIYGPDADPAFPCSSEILQVGQLATCYNSSWIYYSIDGCDIPSITPSPTPLPSSSSSSSIQSSTGLSTTSTTASPSPSSPQKSTHTGVIVGGIVGGVGSLALVFLVAILLVRRRSKPLPPDPPSYELSNDRALLEISNPEKVAHTELWGQEAATEIGRNSVHIPPAELPGDNVVEQDKKGINPIIKLHMAR